MKENKCLLLPICGCHGKDMCGYYTTGKKNICKYLNHIDDGYYCMSEVAQLNKVTIMLMEMLK